MVWFGIPAYIWWTAGATATVAVAASNSGIGTSSSVEDKISEYEDEKCKDDDNNNCDLEFVRDIYNGGDTKTCMYKNKSFGAPITFPQDAELPCMPVNKKRCLVYTAFMGPKARRIYKFK